MNRRSLTLGGLVIALIFVFNILTFYSEESLILTYFRMPVISYFRSEKSSRKTILFYTTFFKSKDFHFGFGKEPFTNLNCPVDDCYITNDRTFLSADGDVSDFDAIIFHPRNMNFKSPDLPDQALRKKFQRYIMLLLESPLHGESKRNWDKLNGLFNWTMTYRLDSDIPMVRGYFSSKSYEPKYPPSNSELITFRPFNASNMDPGLLESIIKDFGHLAKRPKQVAWVVSHCKTKSKREEYVKQLEKHIEVDIYGDCGKKCARGKNSNYCFDLIQENYKFYLSFENSLCEDYVTEKLFDQMNVMMLPIVMGGANYSKLLPPHSYINVEDFESPKDLGKYLLHLSQSEDEYLSYFWWRQEYQLHLKRAHAYCRLCEKLHQDKVVKVYEDISAFWVSHAHCVRK